MDRVAAATADRPTRHRLLVTSPAPIRPICSTALPAIHPLRRRRLCKGDGARRHKTGQRETRLVSMELQSNHSMLELYQRCSVQWSWTTTAITVRVNSRSNGDESSRSMMDADSNLRICWRGRARRFRILLGTSILLCILGPYRQATTLDTLRLLQCGGQLKRK